MWLNHGISYFTTDFWQCNKSEPIESHQSGEFYANLVQIDTDDSNFENEPKCKTIGIAIQGLTKNFKSDRAVVNNLNLNIYENQITTLLGQNGAGKSTTISMLIGMMEPTSGTAIINGIDIRKNMDFARCSMGFCPQHNILFDELTVQENIQFFCSLKGVSKKVAKREAIRYMQLLELYDKRNAMSSTLSGGMKRKLSVVIALCGQSKVVFLDEPTSGMDPGARRTLWDILLAEKKGRTILLTTHFMDEADVLSDRIAILADGELKCAGSTFFLKKRFGTGYHLICEKDRYCDSNQITKLLRQHIPTIQIDSENENELSYILSEQKHQQLSVILSDLEENLSKLNLIGIGLTLSQLEEIFMKIGVTNQSNIAKPNAIRLTLYDHEDYLSGCSLLINHAIAMSEKRFFCWLRSWISFCFFNAFAIIVMALFIFGNQIFTTAKQSPALDINLNEYKSPIIVLQQDQSGLVFDILERKTHEFHLDFVIFSFSNQFKKNLQGLAELKVINGGMSTFLQGVAQTSLREYNYQYATAASVESTGTILAWFNNQAIHSATLALDLVHNALIKWGFGESYSIRVSNAPFRSTRESTEISYFSFLFPTAIAVTMSVLSSSDIFFYVKVMQSKSKTSHTILDSYVFLFSGRKSHAMHYFCSTRAV